MAAAWVPPVMPELEVVLELVPGLLDGTLVVADPVVLEGAAALFSFTCPLESRQWVAADTPDGFEAAGGGDVV